MLAQTAERHSDGPRARRSRLCRVEARRRADPGASCRRRRGDLHAQPCRHHRSRAGAGPQRSARWTSPRSCGRRGHRAARGRPSRGVPGDHEPVRHEGRGSRHAAHDVLLRLPARRRPGLDRPPGARAARGTRRARATRQHRSAARDERPGCRPGVPRRGAGTRSRGCHGEVARGTVRGRAARCRLAQGEARAHARPRRPRCGVGPRPSDGEALEPPPRRPRSCEWSVRDARQDVQGNDGRDARVADGAPASARDGP